MTLRGINSHLYLTRGDYHAGDNAGPSLRAIGIDRGSQGVERRQLSPAREASRRRTGPTSGVVVTIGSQLKKRIHLAAKSVRWAPGCRQANVPVRQCSYESGSGTRSSGTVGMPREAHE